MFSPQALMMATDGVVETFGNNNIGPRPDSLENEMLITMTLAVKAKATIAVVIFHVFQFAVDISLLRVTNQSMLDSYLHEFM